MAHEGAPIYKLDWSDSMIMIIWGTNCSPAMAQAPRASCRRRAWPRIEITSLSPPTRVWHLAQIDNHVEGIVGSISWGKSMTLWTTSGIKSDDFKEGFLGLTEWSSVRLSWKNSTASTSRGFLNYERELYSKRPSTPAQRKIVVASHTSIIDLPFEFGWWSSILISQDSRLCRFFFLLL